MVRLEEDFGSILWGDSLYADGLIVGRMQFVIFRWCGEFFWEAGVSS